MNPEGLPADGDYLLDLNEHLREGASKKWDMSRRFQVTIKNPNFIPIARLDADLGGLYACQPKDITVPEPFPLDLLKGNDDAWFSDDEDDPYHDHPGTGGEEPWKKHYRSQVVQMDSPSSSLPQGAGTEGFTFEQENLFGEFLRLQLNKRWFRVSDDLDWKHCFRAKFLNGTWTDNGSACGLGH